MTDEAAVQPGQTPAPALPEPPSQRRRLPVGLRWLTGAIGPAVTTIIAFLMGGLVVVLTGKDPFKVYHAVFNGTGLNWFFHVGSHSARIPFATSKMWFPFDTSSVAAQNLQQTLLLTTPIIFTGLALAFAFRCGMFNIGGQGQYLVGSYFAVWIGSSLHGLSGPLHIVVAIVVAALAGGAWAGIAGFLKATVGAHEVIMTIMLNWIAYWVGSWLFGLGGPLQSSTNTSTPVSNDITDNAHLHVFWGDPVLQGLHVGFFIAIAALVVFWIILNRTTLGFEVRAVGYNPDAARYGGISVARNYFLAMAISGTFAGLAGAMDILGWQFRLSTGDVQTSVVGFTGIAVALLGRNTAIGTGLAALLFGALFTGTSTRNLDPDVFPPELASNLTLLIQGLVVLFVGVDILVLWVLGRARRR